MKKIVVLKGGTSPERDVSLVSGAEIAKELRAKGWDVTELDPSSYSSVTQLIDSLHSEQPSLVFNGLHGGSGENGELQAALNLAGFVSTGSGFKACCITMDKYITKLIVASEGIPVPKHIIMRENLLNDYQDTLDYSSFATQLGLPIIVKPNDAGSSVGISKVDSLQELKPAVLHAFQYSNTVLLEEYIPGRELTVTVLDGVALPVVEIVPKSGWYDYNNKYSKGNSIYISPAELEDAKALVIQLYATRIWKAVSLSGYARIDFRYYNGIPYFLEVNTLPGMTSLSLTPMAAKAAGITFGDLLQKIIDISLQEQGGEK
ncbi:MAG: D-alanine--D-alanine ligase [Candidatus Cloacimonetes bacterium]|nr:D-alanine--D-alanine ligase [Candidatus Cloacimonadota bacterium]